MSTASADRLPVIVGIGEITDRPPKGEAGLEPLQLIERAARAADEDAGGGWLARVERLDVVPQLTWPYTDLPQLVAQRLSLGGMRTQETELAGDMPVRMLLAAAEAIAAGEARAVLLCGGEAMQSLRAGMMHGRPPDGWTPLDKPWQPPRGADYVTELAARYRLADPTEVYALYENALRAARGQSAAEAQAESGALWQRFAAVAAGNPWAWDTTAWSAEQIVTADAKNRLISHPYTKRMVAQAFVNQGAACILTSRADALAAGVPEERLVYVWSGAGASDIDDFLSRPRFDRSPPMHAVLQQTLAVNELDAGQLDALELYSCFPCVPKLALQALPGLRAGVAPTVAGGLSFFGGPLGNYMSHAITAMVRALRGDATTGLLYGNGGYVTKHCAAVLADRPPAQPPRKLDAQPDANEASPALVEQYAGPAQLETCMVKYDTGSRPEYGTVIARTPGGERTVAQVAKHDSETLATLIDAAREPIGRPGRIAAGDKGRQNWQFDN